MSFGCLDAHGGRKLGTHTVSSQNASVVGQVSECAVYVEICDRHISITTVC